MRWIIFAGFLLWSGSVNAADMQPSGFSDAEDRAAQAASTRSERQARQAARAEAERKAAEKARLAREEAERQAAAEAARRAQEEAERRAAEEEARLAREEAERKAAEEAERLAREEAERKAAEEAARLARKEAERQAAEEAERLARQEAERKAAEEAARLAREEAEREAAEEAARLAREEAERQAAAEAARQAQEEAKRKAAEEAERVAAEQERIAEPDSQTPQAQASVMVAGRSEAASSINAKKCVSRYTISNEAAASAIAETARNDADANAAAPAKLTLLAQDRIETLSNAHALDRETVRRAYFAGVCTRLHEIGAAQFSLEPVLLTLAESLGVVYPVPAEDQPQVVAEAAEPDETTVAAREQDSAQANEGASTEDDRAEPVFGSPQDDGGSGRADGAAEGQAEEAAPGTIAETPSTEDRRADAPPADTPETAIVDEGAGDDADTVTEEEQAAEATQPEQQAPAETASREGAAAETETAERPAPTAPIAQQALPQTLPRSALRAPEAPSASPEPRAVRPAPTAPPQPDSAGGTGEAAPAEAEDSEDEVAVATDGGDGSAPGGTEELTPADGAPDGAEQQTTEAAPEEAEPAADRAAADDAAETAAEETEAAAEDAGEAAPASRVATPTPDGMLGEEECRALGVLGNCPDLNAVLDQLLERPLEYNHPSTMLMDNPTEISLVLRTDWESEEMPAEVSEEMRDLPGEVKQGISKITRIMSAELSGRNFEITPEGRQERTVAPPNPVNWNWNVTPTETGADQVLKLRLYAHLQSPQGTMPPILVKTLDATIDVDVTTWDWLVNQARTLEPIYAIGAALIGLLTAILTFLIRRRYGSSSLVVTLPPDRGPAQDGPGGSEPSPRSGPVIGDLSQSAADSRTPAGPAAAPPVAGRDTDRPNSSSDQDEAGSSGSSDQAGRDDKGDEPKKN